MMKSRFGLREKAAGGNRKNRMAENRAWIDSKMVEGYIIVDIGLDPNRARRGSCHAMELHETLVSRDHQRYYPVPWP